MRVGVALFAQNYTDWERYSSRDWDSDPLIADSKVLEDELVIGDLVEPLGFDSIWSVEHHFTPYTMDPNVLQFLTFFAARTKRIDFGTMAVVLPWHDPIRVAEQASMLDNFLQGRKLKLGFARGAAKVEFDGLGVDMNSSRERFLEALDVVRKALSLKHFSHEGKFFQIPDLSIRPRPRNNLLDDMYMAWGSPTSVAVAAENGLRPLLIPQKGWQTHVDEMRQYNRIRMERGLSPAQPVPLLATYVDEDPERAAELGRKYVTEYADSGRRHYQFDDPARFDVKGYEHYSGIAAEFAKANPEKIKMAERRRELAESGEAKKKSTAELMQVFIESHVWGTPEQVIEQLRERLHGVGAEEFVTVVNFGSMPVDHAERSLRLFAEKVLPELHSWATPSPILPEEGSFAPVAAG